MAHILQTSDLQKINDLIFVGFNEQPNIDSIRNAYVETAEVQVYKWLGVSSNEKYDERFRPAIPTVAQRQDDERIKLATQFLVASKLLISFPQILEEQVLRESVRYQDIDVFNKIRQFELETEMLLTGLVNADLFRPSSIFSLVTQKLAF